MSRQPKHLAPTAAPPAPASGARAFAQPIHTPDPSSRRGTGPVLTLAQILGAAHARYRKKEGK